MVPTIETTKTPQVAAPQKAPAKPKREQTADLTRVLLFLGVVIAHCVTTINYTPDVIRQTGLVSAALHLTRYGFVAVTLLAPRGLSSLWDALMRLRPPRRHGADLGPDLYLANANAALEMLGHTVVGWMWLRQASVAVRALPSASVSDRA